MAPVTRKEIEGVALAACRALDRGDLARARALAAEVMNGLAALESHRRELGAARQRRYQAKTDDAKAASELTVKRRQSDAETASDDAKAASDLGGSDAKPASGRASSLSPDPESSPDLISRPTSRPQSANPGSVRSARPREGETVEQLLRRTGFGFEGHSSVPEAVARYLAELGLVRYDSLGRTQDLTWIAERPAAELHRVVETLLVDPWAQKRMGRCSAPEHIRKQWQKYLDGPEQPEAPREDPEAIAVRVKKLCADLDREMFLAGCEQGERAAAHEREAKRIEAELAKLRRAS